MANDRSDPVAPTEPGRGDDGARAASGDDATLEATDTTVGAPGAAVAPGDAPEQVGDDYRVTGEVGRGGMGRVVRAHDRRLGREVALKELLGKSAEARARFEREARTAARLQHPSIVPVYELAATADGHPYYAMKLVSGRTLRAAIDAAPTVRARLALLRHVIAVAHAIAYAHSQRVIHRDLKTANVIVGEFGETIVIDWGLAKDLRDGDGDGEPARLGRAAAPDTRAAADAQLTEAGAVMGTPAYMAPEQALGDPVDERADVYALGVILYELLAGALPFAGGSTADVLAQVIEGRPRPLAEVAPEVPRDLAAIVAKAMARARDDRYRDARELAAELERFAAGQLVGAHRYGAGERLTRWLRRHRAAVTVAALALVALIAVGAVALVRVLDARRRAEDAQAEAEHQRDTADAARADAVARADDALIARARLEVERDPRGALTALRGLSAGSPRWAEARAVAADAFARGVPAPIATLPGEGRGLLVRTDGTIVAAYSEPGQLTTRLWSQDGRGPARITPATQVALAVGGATAWVDGDVAVVETAAGTTRVPIGGAPITALAVAEDAAHVAAIVDGHVVVVDAATGARVVLGEVPRDAESPGLAFTGGGHVVALSNFMFVLAAWRLDGSRVPLPSGTLESLTITADGAWTAATRTDRTVVVRGRDGRERVVGHFHTVALAHLDPTERRVVWTDQNDAHVWELAAGHEHVLRGHIDAIAALAISADGRWLATGGNDAAVRIWDLDALDARAEPFEPGGPSGQPLVLPHDEVVTGVAFEPGGRDVVTLTAHGALARWHVPPVRAIWAARVVDATPDLTWSARVVDGVVQLVRFPDGATRRMPGPPRLAHVDDLSLDRRLAFAGGRDVLGVAVGAEVHLWAFDGDDVTTLRADAPLDAIAVAPDAAAVVAVIGPRVVLLRAGAAPRRLASSAALDASHSVYLGWSPDGAYVRVAFDTGALIVRVADGHVLTPTGDTVHFSADGHLAAVGGRGTLARCDLARDACELLDGVRGRDARWMAIANDGRVGVGFDDGEVALWPAGGRTPRVLGHHRATVTRVVFSTDEQRLVTSGNGPEIHVWSLRGGAAVDRVLRGELGFAVGLHAGPGRVRIADWYSVQELDDDLPDDEAGLRARLADAR